MKLIGRDKLLKREIYPRVQKHTPFVLTGQRGIGKSAVLKWAYDVCKGQKLYLSCRGTYGQTIKAIAELQGMDIKKKKLAEIETEIMKGDKIHLFLDDLERATPKLIALLGHLNDFWPISFAGVEPFREEVKRLLWGKKRIKIIAVAKKYRLGLAEEAICATGRPMDRNEIAIQSKGVPARAWALARGEIVKEEEDRVEGEEVNIAPILLLAIAGIMIVRFIGLGTGERELYILGGLGMGIGVFARFFIYKAMRK